MYGSDQAASIETHALRDFVETVRKVPLLMGTGEKTVTTDEAAVRTKLRVNVT
jgi:sialic acid synthase SpsE